MRPLFVLLLIALAASSAHAQTAFSVGFTVPFYLNQEFMTGQDETDSGIRHAIGASGEFIKFATSVVAFHTGVEFPTTTVTHFTHHGTAGFDSDMTRREIVVSECVGFHSKNVVGQAGFGLVLTRINEQITEFRPLPPSPTRTRQQTVLTPSIMGGVELPIPLSARVALVPQFKIRLALISDGLGHPYDSVFAAGRIVLTPGVAVRFR